MTPKVVDYLVVTRRGSRPDTFAKTKRPQKSTKTLADNVKPTKKPESDRIDFHTLHHIKIHERKRNLNLPHEN